MEAMIKSRSLPIVKQYVSLSRTTVCRRDKKCQIDLKASYTVVWSIAQQKYWRSIFSLHQMYSDLTLLGVETSCGSWFESTLKRLFYYLFGKYIQIPCFMVWLTITSKRIANNKEVFHHGACPASFTMVRLRLSSITSHILQLTDLNWLDYFFVLF